MRELLENLQAARFALNRGNLEEAREHVGRSIAILEAQLDAAQAVHAEQESSSGEEPSGEAKPPWFNG